MQYLEEHTFNAVWLHAHAWKNTEHDTQTDVGPCRRVRRCVQCRRRFLPDRFVTWEWTGRLWRPFCDALCQHHHHNKEAL